MGKGEDSDEQSKVAAVKRKSAIQQFSGTQGPECSRHDSPSGNFSTLPGMVAQAAPARP